MKKLLLSIFIASSFGVNAQFWTEKATGFTTPARTLNSISIVDANVIWANAFDNSIPATPDYTIKEFTKSTDGGDTWMPGTLDLGEDGAGLGISSITAASSLTAWISAYPDSGGFGGIWKTTDGGVIWTKQTSALYNNPDESYTNFVYFWDANNGIAQGDPENGEFEIYTTNDGGATWARVPDENIPDPITDETGEYGYNNLYTVSGNTIWFGTDRGRIFKSTDKGLNWTVSTSPSSDFGLDRFTFSDTDKGLLMTYNPTNLYNTIDGGETWEPISTSGFFNTSITYIPGTSTVISGGAATPFGSSYSLDDGLTWTAIDAVYHGTLAFLNSSFGFSAGMNTSNTTGGIFKFNETALKTTGFNYRNSISIYPNPTNGNLQINSEKSTIKLVEVFDLSGKQVYNSAFSNLNQVSIDLKSLETGIYMLKSTLDANSIEFMKIIKN